MKTIFYSTKQFERPYLEAAVPQKEAEYVAEALSVKTASLAKGFDCVSVFSADDASAAVLQLLQKNGVRYITTRAAGYDNIDIAEANTLELVVANVPEYSPYAVAEHAMALLLALNRKLIKANQQVQHHNFSLDNLVGFDLHQKKVGVIGTGRIGSVMTRILHGFGCTVLAYDVNRDQQLEHRYNVYYMGLNTLCSMADIITVHLPLNKSTHHLLNGQLFRSMKKGVLLINTARGGVIDTDSLIEYLENGKVGGAGLDVYENEKGIFFHDLSAAAMDDTRLLKLLSFKNVLITPHQAFATHEALTNIAQTTWYNIDCWDKKRLCENEITYVPQAEKKLVKKI